MSILGNVFHAHRLERKSVSTDVVLFVLWVLFSLNIVTADSGLRDGSDRCPVECSCLGNVVDCSDLQMIEVPSGLPLWTERLELKNNNIASLESDAFFNLGRLRELDLSANRLGNNFSTSLADIAQLKVLKANKNLLSQIPDLSFVRSLTHLTLSHNVIESINGTSLLNLPELQNLDLSGNKISVLQKGSFLAPNVLTHLNLNANQIRVIENGSLDNLTSLVELRLNKNHLTQLKDLFTNLGKLRLLELNRNELQQIQGLSLRGMTSLEELRLKRNKIEKLEDGAFWPLKNLVSLQLDYNLLFAVKKGGLFGLENLQKLTLSHNRITTIEPQAWDICREITELDLSHNELSSIERGAFEYLGKLETLKMDHNQITYISDGAFNSTPNLRVLDLNSNKISYMVEDMNGAFAPLYQLLKLGLAYNRIKSINQNAFTGLSRVNELDLTGNNITSIQENAFVSMPNLIQLKMNSKTLVCDCALQWLSVWLREHMYNDAQVHCGYPHWLQNMPLMQLHQANFTCDEYPKPRIIKEPASQMSIKGDNVTLVCQATSTADAPLQFTWKHDNIEVYGADLEINNESSEHGVTMATSTLHLTNITHANAGRYQCTVSNAYGTTYSAKAKISVLIYPSFSKVPHDIRVTAGSTASLECSAEGQPSPQIAWQKDGGNDFPAARERRMHMMKTDYVLSIVDVKAADSGVYSCTAQNLAGLIVANATLTILETPSFMKPMENKEIMVGRSIVLECMASGSPKPKLTWRKDGSPLQTTERHFFTADDQLLIIVNTIASDAGSYECEMTNSLGSTVGVTQLTVNPVSLKQKIMKNQILNSLYDTACLYIVSQFPAPNAIVNEDDILGLIIITVVCCAVGTSIVWVVIICQARKRLNNLHNASSNSEQPADVVATIPDTQTHLYLETSSQHSKDSGTGDSTNPSNDQLQLCLPEEIVTCSVNNEEGTGAVNIGDPLLRYTNHDREDLVDREYAI